MVTFVLLCTWPLLLLAIIIGNAAALRWFGVNVPLIGQLGLADIFILAGMKAARLQQLRAAKDAVTRLLAFVVDKGIGGAAGIEAADAD